MWMRFIMIGTFSLTAVYLMTYQVIFIYHAVVNMMRGQ